MHCYKSTVCYQMQVVWTNEIGHKDSRPAEKMSRGHMWTMQSIVLLVQNLNQLLICNKECIFQFCSPTLESNSMYRRIWTTWLHHNCRTLFTDQRTLKLSICSSIACFTTRTANEWMCKYYNILYRGQLKVVKQQSRSSILTLIVYVT